MVQKKKMETTRWWNCLGTSGFNEGMRPSWLDPWALWIFPASTSPSNKRLIFQLDWIGPSSELSDYSEPSDPRKQFLVPRLYFAEVSKKRGANQKENIKCLAKCFPKSFLNCEWGNGRFLKGRPEKSFPLMKVFCLLDSVRDPRKLWQIF